MSKLSCLWDRSSGNLAPTICSSREQSPITNHRRMAIHNTVVDIQNLIEDYAWEQFLDLQAASKKNEYKGLDRDDVTFEINTKKMPVIHEDPEYHDFRPTSSKPSSLFKTVFTNNTDRSQEYSFKTERTTESTCTIIKEQGFCFGVESQISLKTPCEILEANVGFKHEISFSKATENTISETLSWGVDSNIVVPARYRTTAELVVEEERYSGSFSLVTYVSGRAVISLIRRRDGVMILPISLSIVEVFREALSNSSKGSKELKSMCTIENNRVVRLITKGNCDFRFASKQSIDITEESLMGNRGKLQD